MSDNESLGFCIRQVDGVLGIYEVVGVTTDGKPIEIHLEKLSEQIARIAQEYLDDLPKETSRGFQLLADRTNEWIENLENPFGLDFAEESDPLYEWHQEALKSGICHTFFNSIFHRLSQAKYGTISSPDKLWDRGRSLGF